MELRVHRLRGLLDGGDLVSGRERDRSAAAAEPLGPLPFGRRVLDDVPERLGGAVSQDLLVLAA
jgi:hypothetical protein